MCNKETLPKTTLLAVQTVTLDMFTRLKNSLDHSAFIEIAW